MADVARVEEALRKYPSFFVSLQDAGIDNERISLENLQVKDTRDIYSNEHKTQKLNLVSYAYFVKGEKAMAYEKNDEVLRQRPDNVMALSNKAWFLFYDKKFSDAEQICKEIERAEYVDKLISRGDVAYAYSRFGLKTYDLAVKEYEKLLKECKQSGVPDKYFCMWSFGLYLQLMCREFLSKTSTESTERRLSILRNVTKIQSSNDTVRLYQARSYANICRIRYDQVCMQYSGKYRYIQLRLEPLQAMEKAYALGNNDVYTLDLIGKFMRYYPEKVKDSISCLKRSNEIHETSKGYHRLALAQKRELENREFRKQPKRVPPPNARIANLMKCPKLTTSLVQYKGQSQLNEVLENLDKAVALNPNNRDAFYDFGLTYRQINEFENALEKFKHIISHLGNTRFYKELLEIANAYEQSGYCMADMTAAGRVPDAERIRLGNKMRSAFKKSVELSCSLLRMVPSLGQLWVTPPTLNQLLTGTAITSKEIRELMFLDERLQSQSALDIIGKLSGLGGHSEDKDKRIRDLISQLVAARNYDDAILSMELITCLPNGCDALDDDTYTETYIRGGLDAYMSGEALLGRLRIGNALTFRKNKAQLRAGERANAVLDEGTANVQWTEVILIYQNVTLKYAADKLSSVFKEVGMKISAYPPSKEIVCDPDTTVMRNYITLVGDGTVLAPENGTDLEEAMGNLAINNFDTNVDLIVEDLDRRTYGKLLVVKLQADTDVPDTLQDFPILTFHAEKKREAGCLNKEDLDFVVSSLKGMANI